MEKDCGGTRGTATKRNYDVIVVGLGAVGSTALYHLAKRGAKVLGVDQFAPPHPYGSSSGETRITRQAIGEGACYTPFSLRSYDLWREIEGMTGSNLLTITGGLIMGSQSSPAILHGRDDFVEETIRAARQYGIAHSVLDAAKIESRFPQFRLEGDERGYYEPMAGFLRPEQCIEDQLFLARRFGAEWRGHEAVLGFSSRHTGEMFVKTERGGYSAAKVIISTGAWVKRFVSKQYKNLFSISRQVLHWFDAESSYKNFVIGNFPIFIWGYGNGDSIYGFPAIDGPRGGVKIAAEQHEHEVETEPDAVSQGVTLEETEAMYRRYVVGRFRTLGRRSVKAITCFYTKTPDSNFIIDVHPEHPNVILASPCSGHGFKHSAAVGEVLAQMAFGENPQIDISPFRLSRFKK